ncbi:MAG TPA: sensor histidine kinase [Candidatus Binatia bacterium]|nr:sensor histidine kinase [Candidatus Binatia bacterium]
MTGNQGSRGRGGALHRLAGQLPRVPPEPPSEPVRYTPALVLYVGVVVAGATAAAALTVRPPFDGPLLALGGCAVVLLAAGAVRALSGVTSHWSASIFAHLGLSLAAGPVGALVAAGAEMAGTELRLHAGWFRGAFNTAHDFLGNLAGWAVFNAITGGRLSLSIGLLAGLAAGASQYVINFGLLAIVQRLTQPDLRLAIYLGQNVANILPYHLGAGFTAFGGVVLVRRLGAGGFVLLLVPVLLLQLFLLVLASRTRAAQVEREAHLRERELLLRQALEASDAERRRIARNLHDGVVQDLAAVTLGLRVRAETGAITAGAMLTAADTTAEAIAELRTLLREIAPPDLQEVGLPAVLDDLAEPLREQGVEVSISVADAVDGVRGAALDAAFRIAQEALRNVAEHARARSVRVEVSRLDGSLRLEIADDGVGFSADQRRERAEAGHLGLRLLHDLAREAGGELAVVSEPSQGTTLRAELPLVTPLPGDPARRG